MDLDFEDYVDTEPRRKRQQQKRQPKQNERQKTWVQKNCRRMSKIVFNRFQKKFTWIAYESDHRVSCALCKISMTAREHILEKHEASEKHISNARGSVDAQSLSPSLDEFEEAFDRLASGSAPPRESRKKSECMDWCVTEGLREAERNFVKDESVVATIHRDESDGRLVLRMTAANQELDTRQFQIGMARDRGGSAKNIFDQTKMLCQRFATRWLDPPHCNRKDVETNVYDEEFFQDVCSKVKMSNTDAAGNEVLASNIRRCHCNSGIFTCNSGVCIRGKRGVS